ncbi:MAG TPA: class I SAM-dependent methyltransferase [Tissierellaceae bacterium]|nr:class I SAM-dependent methyltransferase [Tissierellaceae bacterium]
MYKEFANLYDQLMNDFDYKEWFLYIEEIFTKFKVSPEKVLEMACGTGNLTYYLGEKGYKLTAFDLSEEMLAIAYKKLNKFKNIKLLKQDMTSFQLNEKYQAVVSICDSINYILCENQLLNTFKNVYKHLETDGIFIFDINSEYKLQEIIGENIFVEDRENIFYIWDNDFEQDRKIHNFYLTFFYGADGINFRRTDEYHRQRSYKEEEVKDLLTSAGFNHVYSYEAFSFKPVAANSERINFVALK